MSTNGTLNVPRLVVEHAPAALEELRAEQARLLGRLSDVTAEIVRLELLLAVIRLPESPPVG